jgi:hypothetical protein
MIHPWMELALSVKATPEIPLSTGKTEIAQAGSIAFSISSRGVESSRHAPEQLIKREQDVWNELTQERPGAFTTSRSTSQAYSRDRFVWANRWCEAPIRLARLPPKSRLALN